MVAIKPELGLIKILPSFCTNSDARLKSIDLNVSGNIDGDDYHVALCGPFVIVDFPKRKQTVAYSIGNIVINAHGYCIKNPDETWDKED